MFLFLFLAGTGIFNPHAYEVFLAPVVNSIQSVVADVLTLFVAIISVSQTNVATIVQALRWPLPTRVPQLPPTPTVPSPSLGNPLAYLAAINLVVVLLAVCLLIFRGLRQHSGLSLLRGSQFVHAQYVDKAIAYFQDAKTSLDTVWATLAVSPPPVVFCASHGHLVVPRHSIPTVVAQSAEREVAEPEQQPLAQPENVLAPAPAPALIDNIPGPSDQVINIESVVAPVASSSNSKGTPASPPAASPTHSEETLVDEDNEDWDMRYRVACAEMMDRSHRSTLNQYEPPTIKALDIEDPIARVVTEMEVEERMKQLHPERYVPHALVTSLAVAQAQKRKTVSKRRTIGGDRKFAFKGAQRKMLEARQKLLDEAAATPLNLL
ncbi:hypothetical protein EIP91_006293 [Steccherinum ochraceum]|uniref:Uncharacterized protein n=1 Tax=Steccherinum ochraceum TaxID=92696 RepID=A0A4V2MXE1_9APHY|nr:hypothetical protein EIP91_006293 [Steccherinum ochraceum]